MERLKKSLKILGGVLLLVVLVGAVLYPFRRNPIGMIAGKELTGAEAAFPSDWRFSDEHFLMAVETRPDDPHSVTTIGFVHEGALHIPAQDGSTKDWTHFVLDDPRVRIKVGERVFPARAVRVGTEDPAPFLESAGKKYATLAARLEGAEAPPEDIWLFRIEPREATR